MKSCGSYQRTGDDADHASAHSTDTDTLATSEALGTSVRGPGACWMVACAEATAVAAMGRRVTGSTA